MNVRISPPTVRCRRPASGFTLVELLVVIAIIGMLVALLVPAVNMAREAGRRTVCLNNQQQLGKAVANYVSAKDKYPAGFSAQVQGSPNGPPPSTGLNGNTLLSFVGWVPPMLPYLEQRPLYDVFQSNGWGNISDARLEVLICPSRDLKSTHAPLSYVVNSGAPDSPSPASGAKFDFAANGVFFDLFSTPASAQTQPFSQDFLSMHDGATMTLMLSESVDALDWTWTKLSNPGDVATAINGEVWWQGFIWDVPGNPAPFDTTHDPTTFRVLNQNRDLDVTFLNAGSVTTQPSGLNSTNPDFAFGRPSSKHPGGFVVTFCGGQSKFLSEDIDYRVYVNLMTPDSVGALVPGRVTTFVTYPNAWYLTTPATPGTTQLVPISEADFSK